MKIKYVSIIIVMFLLGCQPKRENVFKYFWICKNGYSIAEKYAKPSENRDKVGFCAKDCNSNSVSELFVDNNFNIYMGEKRLGKIIKCNNKEMIIKSIDGDEKGYYIPDVEK